MATKKRATQYDKGYLAGFLKAMKACGNCELCYGKGYSTQGHGGETKYNTCVCTRGKQIDTLITTVTNRAIKMCDKEGL